MRKCGVLGSYIIFMCIRVYLVQRKKHKSPYRPYFMLTSSLVPLYPNLSRLPRALFNGSPPHMFCALFLFWFPHVQYKERSGLLLLLPMSVFPLFLFFCEVRASLPPPTRFISDSTNIYHTQCVVLIIFRSSSTSMKNWTTLNPKVTGYANGSTRANQKQLFFPFWTFFGDHNTLCIFISSNSNLHTI